MLEGLMNRKTGKAKNKGQKGRAAKKVSIKDLQPRKEVKAGKKGAAIDYFRG